MTAFLAFLLLAAQVLLSLYATSVVTTVSFDAARVVAGSAGGVDVQPAAEAAARRLLGRFADRVEFEWEYADVDADGEEDEVRLHVDARPPGLLPALGNRLPFSLIRRTIVVRIERLR